MAGRNSRQWARYDKNDLHNLRRKLRGSGSDKYVAVNTCHDATLEVRIFASSLKRERILMIMELVEAVAKYTESIKIQDIVSGNAFTDSQFIKWLGDYQDARYDILKEYVTEYVGTGRVGE